MSFQNANDFILNAILHLKIWVYHVIILSQKSKKQNASNTEKKIQGKYLHFQCIILKVTLSHLYFISHIKVFIILLGLSQFSSLTVMSLRPHRLQHTRLPCPSPAPRAAQTCCITCSNSCPSSRWCHPTISFCRPLLLLLQSLFSILLPPFSASGSFPMSLFFASGDQSIGASASASVLPMSIRTDFL